MYDAAIYTTNKILAAMKKIAICRPFIGSNQQTDPPDL